MPLWRLRLIVDMKTCPKFGSCSGEIPAPCSDVVTTFCEEANEQPLCRPGSELEAVRNQLPHLVSDLVLNFCWEPGMWSTENTISRCSEHRERAPSVVSIAQIYA